MCVRQETNEIIQKHETVKGVRFDKSFYTKTGISVVDYSSPSGATGRVHVRIPFIEKITIKNEFPFDFEIDIHEEEGYITIRVDVGAHVLEIEICDDGSIYATRHVVDSCYKILETVKSKYYASSDLFPKFELNYDYSQIPKVVVED